ncbi:MAG: cyclin family protein [Nitrososphaerales archaeon]
MKSGKIKLFPYVPLRLFQSSVAKTKIDSETADKIRETAKELVKTYYKRNPTDARAPSTIGYASLYVGCMLNGFYLTLEDISRTTSKGVGSIREAYKDIQKILGLKNR